MKAKRVKYKFNFITFLKGLAFAAFAVGLALAIITYNPLDRSFNHTSNLPVTNLLGPIGSYTSNILVELFGISALLFVLVPLIWSGHCLFSNLLTSFWLKLSSLLISVIILSTISTELGRVSWPLSMQAGGVVGKLLYNLIPHMYRVGSSPLLAVLLLIFLYLACGIKLGVWQRLVKNLYLLIAYSCRLTWYSFLCLSRFVRIIVGKFKRKQEYELPYQELLKSTVQDMPLITKPIKSAPVAKTIKPQGNFILPTLDLLNPVNPKMAKNHLTPAMLEENSDRLMRTLSDFGIKGKMLGNYPGPVVTLYELEPAAGTKSSRIIGLADDIARSMCALSTRISTVPGKNSIGVELPNQIREVVYLKEMIQSPEYQNSQHILPIILGKDIGGSPIIVDLATMPHLLVAGTTGSGKSVAINTMILSLLYKLTPEQCKLVMIDPKMLELSVYDGIPHLLAPVVTESPKAVVALKWTVKEMENRYRLMASLGVRNILGYNQKIEEAGAKGIKLSKQVQTGFDPETGRPIYEEIALDVKPLPYIVVIVDEMADLMIVAGKEIEASIQRLAQMARAAGIHIIMATQRPSVDVITGVIKANFPTRISFQVTSKIDSRTILGDSGAEQLLGKGDMLYMSGGNKIRRIHGPFVADSEVEHVVNFLKSQAAPVFTVDITEDDDEAQTALSLQECDELYEQAVALVMGERKVSISYIQRYFKIGYNRSATIVEQMERNGIVSKADAMGKREIIVPE